MELTGIHHITAIAGHPQANLDFYAGVLGLRLVKVTVNFDDPTTYHFYYGDGSGKPGTIVTFFPWPGAPHGRRGAGEVTATAFAIPGGSEAYWEERLRGRGVVVKREGRRFGESVVSFQDPDGMVVELIAQGTTSSLRANAGGPVPAGFAICGLHSASLTVGSFEKTSKLLSETMGYTQIGQDGNRFRYSIGSGEAATIVDLLHLPELERGAMLAGSVHHIAFRTSTQECLEECREELLRLEYHVTEILDRKYFQSIYFREPSGTLFEIATDPPGFAVDESLEGLGSTLVLPAWLEERREELLSKLPALHLPVRPML